MKDFSVVFPTYHCPEYANILIRSFERFKPADLSINYIVVENSDDASYRESTIQLAENVTWIQNPLDLSSFPPNVVASFANAFGVMRGLFEVKTDHTFLAHSDTCVTSEKFFKAIDKKLDEGFKLIGTVRDNSRVKAIHVSGMLGSTDLFKNVDMSPNVTWSGVGNAIINYDVGDAADILCRSMKLPSFCFKNTENMLLDVKAPYDMFPVDRCLDDDGDVIFMHLGRGADKLAGRYTKPGRVLKDAWVDFCEGMLVK